MRYAIKVGEGIQTVTGNVELVADNENWETFENRDDFESRLSELQE